MLMSAHYQNAYVTHDLEKAMALLTDRYGVGDYMRFEPDMLLRTAQGDKQSAVRVALAWCGGMQIELIEPVSGHLDHYLHCLPADKSDASPRFHHIGVRRDDLDAMLAEVRGAGFPIVFESEVPGMYFAYLDTRADLGHYLEYVWSTPEIWEMTGWPKALPVM